jgi:sugar phosphate permease
MLLDVVDKKVAATATGFIGLFAYSGSSLVGGLLLGK